jgi:hypothetical protein
MFVKQPAYERRSGDDIAFHFDHQQNRGAKSAFVHAKRRAGFPRPVEKIQIAFVDEPRKAVEQADQLVADTIKRLTEMFASERNKLEREWDKADNVSTEDLRVALRRYRSFFDRLLSV